MEVIQWTTLWDSYKDEFENQSNLGKNLGEKAAEDLRERVIEHVIPLHCYIFLLYSRFLLQVGVLDFLFEFFEAMSLLILLVPSF